MPTLTATLSPRTRHLIGSVVQRFGLLIFLLVLLVFASLASPAFLRPRNLLDLATQAAPLGIVVLGQALVIMVRGLDLSSRLPDGNNCCSGDSLQSHFRCHDRSHIYCGDCIFSCRGPRQWVAGGKTWRVTLFGNTGNHDHSARLAFCLYGRSTRQHLAAGNRLSGEWDFSGLPVNLWVLGSLAIGLSVVLNHSVFGRQVYMVGGNPRAAELVGLAPHRVIITAYVICSVLAGIAGMFLLGYVGTVSNWVGQGYELDSIIAAVMGGVALGGGRGTVLGALLGVAVLIVISNLVLLLGLPIETQLIVKGLIIVGAAAFYRARN